MDDSMGILELIPNDKRQNRDKDKKSQKLEYIRKSDSPDTAKSCVCYHNGCKNKNTNVFPFELYCVAEYLERHRKIENKLERFTHRPKLHAYNGSFS